MPLPVGVARMGARHICHVSGMQHVVIEGRVVQFRTQLCAADEQCAAAIQEVGQRCLIVGRERGKRRLLFAGDPIHDGVLVQPDRATRHGGPLDAVERQVDGRGMLNDGIEAIDAIDEDAAADAFGRIVLLDYRPADRSDRTRRRSAAACYCEVGVRAASTGEANDSPPAFTPVTLTKIN